MSSNRTAKFSRSGLRDRVGPAAGSILIGTIFSFEVDLRRPNGDERVLELQR